MLIFLLEGWLIADGLLLDGKVECWGPELLMLLALPLGYFGAPLIAPLPRVLTS